MVRLWQKREKSSRDEFDRLVRCHVEMLYQTALRMTADTHIAEDLVQETCLRAYRAFDSFKPGTNFKAWLYRILCNLTIDNARRNAKASFVEWNDQEPSDIWSGAHSTIGRSPEVHVLHKSFMNDAFRAMAQLSPEIRIVVALAILEDFSYAEIAQSVGCPIGTVRSRLSRGRKQLQVELGEYLPGKKTSGASRTRPVIGRDSTKV
jgi:RNA polymerase sigma-70 factor, ECF subfamily